MSKDIRLIEIGEEIHEDNKKEAARVRKLLSGTGISMINVMASPGAGKTSLILRTLEGLGAHVSPGIHGAGKGASEESAIPGGTAVVSIPDTPRCAVIEADMDSLVDSEKIAGAGVEAVQIRTGGFCHVDAWMVMKTLESLDLEALDLIFLENVGNLICPAQFDTGAAVNVMILSVPEGDDKALKYPLMFRGCEALVVNKMDFLELTDFDMKKLKQRVKLLNPGMEIFPVSCRTGEGIEEWITWLKGRLTL